MDKESSKNLLPQASEKAARLYYKGDPSAVLDFMGERCIFIGAGSDVYYSRADMEKDLTVLFAMPEFSMFDCNFRLVPTESEDHALIMAEYSIQSTPQANVTITAKQRLTADFEYTDKGWKAYLIHVSNEWNETGHDETYPTKVSHQTLAFIQQVIRDEMQSSGLVNRVRFDAGSTSVLVDPELVIYAESAGKRCTLHMVDRNTTINVMLGDAQKVLPDFFERIHRYYLVNVKYIEKISRSGIKLATGDVLPIPERRSPEIRRALLEHASLSRFSPNARWETPPCHADEHES